jgi:hypothetical protein
MNRSAYKFGLAVALVSGVLAFSTAPAQAQEYMSGYSAPAPTYSYYYPPSNYFYGHPSYYYPPEYCSYYYAPAYRDCYPCDGAYVRWRGRCGWFGRGWLGRRWWR